jgi:hypothetical protein
MSISRNESWSEIADEEEHLTVFLKFDEAIEGILGDFNATAQKSYKIETTSGSVSRTSRDQVSDAVDSLGGSPTKLSVRYSQPYDGQGGGASVSIITQPIGDKHKTFSMLLVTGDQETEINGLFSTLRNRLSAEIKRQFPKSKIAKQKESQTTAIAPDFIPTILSNSKKTWTRRLRHPIIAGLIVVLVPPVVPKLWPGAVRYATEHFDGGGGVSVSNFPNVEIVTQGPDNASKYCETFSGTGADDPKWPLWSSARSTEDYFFKEVVNFPEVNRWNIQLNIGDNPQQQNTLITVKFFYVPMRVSDQLKKEVDATGTIRRTTFPNEARTFPSSDVNLVRPKGDLKQPSCLE